MKNIQLLIIIIFIVTFISSAVLLIDKSISNASALPYLNPVPSSCADSDDGKDYFTAGYVEGFYGGTDTIYRKNDLCIQELRTLIEWYCVKDFPEGSFPQAETVNCPNGCATDGSASCER